MRLIKLLFLFLCVGLLLSKCQKEEIELGKEHPNTTEVSSLQNTVEIEPIEMMFSVRFLRLRTLPSRQSSPDQMMKKY